jgi:hypothetical protein
VDIGEYVLEAVFQGSLGEAFSRNPFKSKPLPQVWADTDLMIISRRWLGERVRADALLKELTKWKVDRFFLSYSHFAALLQKDDQERLQLAAKGQSRALTSMEADRRNRWARAAKASWGKAETVQESSDEKTEDLLKKIRDPLVLMKDGDIRRLRQDRQELKDRPRLDMRIQVASRIDELIASMLDSANLLKQAKMNIALIELGEVQAEEV